MKPSGIILLAVVGYVVYILAFRPVVINFKYGKKKQGILVTENFDNITLLEHLQEKNFSYPELRNIRHNELGQVIIEGKYTSHPIEIQEQTLYVGRGEKGLDEQRANCILEAVVIEHYLTKFFNPNAPIDAYEEYLSFKRRRKQPLIVSTALSGTLLILLLVFTGKELLPQINSSNISASYLTQYSSEKTIGEAFDDFFGNPRWKSYEIGIQKYVDFEGKMRVDDEPAIAVITFAILDDQFRVEIVKIDNEELNPFSIDSFFQAVFAGKSTDDIGKNSTSKKVDHIKAPPTSFFNESESKNVKNERKLDVNTPNIFEHKAPIKIPESNQGASPDTIDPFPESMYQGQIDGIPIGLGDSELSMRLLMGEPEDFGTWEGSYYYIYPVGVTFFTDMSDDTITMIALRKGFSFLGITVGQTFSEIQQVLGESDVEFSDLSGAWELIYPVGDYSLVFSAEDADGPTTSVQFYR